MEAVPNHAIPDLSDKGFTYKELYRSERHVDDNEMRKMWGPKVNGKACYRFKLLKENKKEEFLSLYKKIHDRTKVLGGQVPQALAMAFLLHCNGREIDWMSFYEHAKSASKSRALANNVDDELESGTVNVTPPVGLSPTAPLVPHKLTSQNLGSSNVTNDANYATENPEMSRILKEWIANAEHDVTKLTLELQLHDDKCFDIRENMKDLEVKQVRLTTEIKKYRDLITQLSSAAKEGVEAVIDLQIRELEEVQLALSQASKDLSISEICRDAELEQLNNLRPCLTRLLAARQIMCRPFQLSPSLPQTLVLGASRNEYSINLKETCPFCERSLNTSEMLLPVIIVECKHAYHVTCCLAHFSGTTMCCDSGCGHSMSDNWLFFLGLKKHHGTKINMIAYSNENLPSKGIGSTPASLSFIKEHKLVPRRLSRALTTTEDVHVINDVSEDEEIDNNDAIQGHSSKIGTTVEVEGNNKELIFHEENEPKTTMISPGLKRLQDGKDMSDTASSPFGKKLNVGNPLLDNGKATLSQSKFDGVAEDNKAIEIHQSLPISSCSPIVKTKKETSHRSQSEESVSPGNKRALIAATRKSKRGEVFGSPSKSPCTKRIKSHKKLLIFELDGVLMKLFENTEPLPSCVMDGAELKHLNHTKIAVLRPRAKELLEWCMEHFQIAIWTTLSSTATNLILNQMFERAVREKLQFTWSSAKCTNTAFKVERKPVLLKELSKVYSEIKGGWMDKNTLLVDDMAYRGFKNSPHTMVCPNTYQPSRRDGDFLFEHLRPWLELLLEAENVEVYLQANPLTNFLDKVSKKAIDTLKKYRYR